MDLAIGSTHRNKNAYKIRVLDICENPKDKSRVVLYRKNKQKKVLQSFHDVLMEIIKNPPWQYGEEVKKKAIQYINVNLGDSRYRLKERKAICQSKPPKHQCKICGILYEWNGKKHVFIMDHIDGDVANNNRENLRLIYPNCDSQLPTYKSKNKNLQDHIDEKVNMVKYAGGHKHNVLKTFEGESLCEFKSYLSSQFTFSKSS